MPLTQPARAAWPTAHRAKGRCAIDLDYLIDRLEELLDHSTRIPMTSRVIIDEDEYLRMIDQMRISVPQEIKNARQVEAERDAILAEAQVKAEKMIAAAQERAAVLAAEHSVLAQAETRAAEVLQEAYGQSAATRAEADAYALEVLEQLAEQLERFSRTVHNGMQMLGTGRADLGRADLKPGEGTVREAPATGRDASGAGRDAPAAGRDVPGAAKVEPNMGGAGGREEMPGA